MIKYRIYTDGNIYHQDEFNDVNITLPFYAEYTEIAIPIELIKYIIDTNEE